jgi:DNA polymerase III psi subunit
MEKEENLPCGTTLLKDVLKALRLKPEVFTYYMENKICILIYNVL